MEINGLLFDLFLCAKFFSSSAHIYLQNVQYLILYSLDTHIYLYVKMGHISSLESYTKKSHDITTNIDNCKRLAELGSSSFRNIFGFILVLAVSNVVTD